MNDLEFCYFHQVNKIDLYNLCKNQFEKLEDITKLSESSRLIFERAWFYFENYSWVNNYYYVLCIRQLKVLKDNFKLYSFLIQDLIDNIKQLSILSR